jgi:hypothetical protein
VVVLVETEVLVLEVEFEGEVVVVGQVPYPSRYW